MKKLILVAVLAVVLLTLLAAHGMAAGPPTVISGISTCTSAGSIQAAPLAFAPAAATQVVPFDRATRSQDGSVAEVVVENPGAFCAEDAYLMTKMTMVATDRDVGLAASRTRIATAAATTPTASSWACGTGTGTIEHIYGMDVAAMPTSQGTIAANSTRWAQDNEEGTMKTAYVASGASPPVFIGDHHAAVAFHCT